ncbi:hypothetical protein C8F01DRAFT_921943, partial [Mycena amicta]
KKSPSADDETDETQNRFWNLSTYKWHSMGDYVSQIFRIGTHDSHNSQIVWIPPQGEAEHRRLKRFYVKTNKNRPDFQVARNERRQQILRKLAQKYDRREHSSKSMALGFDASEPLQRTNPTDKYHMSRSAKFSENLYKWVRGNIDDPAVKGFIPKLKNHILARILGGDEEEDFDEEDRETIHFVDNRIYRHKTIRFNYTTYDVRRKQDSCNPRTQSDIMVLNPSDNKTKSPYWFGCITGIGHINVLHTGRRSRSDKIQTFDFLNIRWFGDDPDQKTWGLHVNRMPRIGFQPADDESAFGFLDPAAVLQACHIIPAFARGYDDNGLGKSIGRPRQELASEGIFDTDFAYYYVNMFPDRDMVMRFRGGGVGHK